VQASCVELTSRFGLGSARHLRPLRSETGLVLAPIDRATMGLVWSDGGYPANARYRDYHRHTIHHHNPWANDGEAYDHQEALALAREHAVDFVARTRARLERDGVGLPGGEGLELVRLDDALERHEPLALEGMADWEASSWGKDGDLSTWSGPQVAEIAFATRAAELELGRVRNPSRTALRELLALQASDWAFMVSRGLAVPYARKRLEGHREALERVLADDGEGGREGLRNLAVFADPAGLLVP
jgi:1,4-alpha-glucan branching enzyme